MKILLTRTDEQNKRSAAGLKALGFEAVCLVLGKVVDSGTELENLSDMGVIITSANAVKILVGRKVIITAPIFVVGERTKQAIEKSQLGKVQYVAANANALADYILNTFAAETMPIMLSYLAGEEISFDFNEYFNLKSDSKKIQTNIQTVYKIIRIEPNKSVLKNSVASCANGIQLHYSAASARHFFELIRKYDLAHESKTMQAITISNKTSHSVDFSLVKSVQNAKIENEVGMFELLFKIEDNCL